MRKLIVALACRNQGSRLFGKPMQNLEIKSNYTVLDNIILLINQVEKVDEIVLGISEGDANKNFINYAKAKKIKYIIGDENDVLSRLIQCADLVDATDILRVTSESPFPYFQLFDSCWEKHIKNNNDATFLDEIIDGCGFEIIKTSALKTSHENGSLVHGSELCSLYIRENLEDFKVEFIYPDNNLIRKDLRLTVDNPEDLVVCREVYQFLKKNQLR